jgi:diadenosine tetraphosphate (Ap4A) HIT family hydrolase
MKRLTRDEAVALLEDQFQSTGCAMCALTDARHDEDLRIAESKYAVVVLDRFAACSGHVLCIVRQHVESVAAIPLEVWQDTQRLVWNATRVFEALLEPRRILVASLGAPTAIATSFPHVHCHVVPVVGDDEACKPSRVFSWQSGVLVYEAGEAEALASELRAAWPT